MQAQEQAATIPNAGVWFDDDKRGVCPVCGDMVSLRGSHCRTNGRVMPVDDKGVRTRYLYCRCGASFKARPES